MTYHPTVHLSKTNGPATAASPARQDISESSGGIRPRFRKGGPSVIGILLILAITIVLLTSGTPMPNAPGLAPRSSSQSRTSVSISSGRSEILAELNYPATTVVNDPNDGFRPSGSMPWPVHGVDRSGTEYACISGTGYGVGPYNLSSVLAMRSWNITSVRIPLNEDCWLDINVNSTVAAPYSGAGYRDFIVNYTDLLESQGIRPILVLQMNAPGTNMSNVLTPPMADEDHAPAFWASVASTFKNDSLVIFDLFNEPHDISWSCWLNGCFQTHTNPGWQTAGMQQLLDVVRYSGADTQLVILGGLNYANDLSEWLSNKPTDPIGSGELGASFHMYQNTDCSSALCWNLTFLPILANSIPLITGEMGEFDCGDSVINSFFSWANSLSIPYLGWSWTTWNSCQGPTLISNYSGTPFSLYGTDFRNHLRGFAAPALTVPTVPLGVTAAAGAASVWINWSAPSSSGTWPVSCYQIAYGTSPSTLNKVVSTGSGSTLSWSVQPLTNGVTYYFAVRAQTPIGFGPYSSPVSAVPKAGALTLSSFSASPNTIGVGQSTDLNVTVTGGITPYTITYTGLPGGCISSNVTSLTCVPSASGVFTVRVFVNDSAGHSVTSTATLTVNAATVTISSVAVSPTAPTAPIGTMQVFTATPTCSATCPKSGIICAWTLTNGAMGSLSAATGTPVNFTAGSITGTVGIFVNATLNGSTKTASAMITITNPASSLTSVAVSPTSPTVASGGIQVFAATPTCASTCPTTGIAYSWSLTNPALGTITGTGASETFTAGSIAVTGGIFVNATLNSATQVDHAIITVTVAPINSLTSVSVSPAAPTLSSGGTQDFTATPKCTYTCPATGITYAWALASTALGSINPTSGSTTTFNAGSAGGTVGLFLNASLNGTARQSSHAMITIRSSSTPTLSSVSVNPSTATLSVGEAATFTASPDCTGGTCPAGTTFTWTQNNALGTLNSNTGSTVKFTAGTAAGTDALFVNGTLNGLTEQSPAVMIKITGSSVPVLSGVAVSPSSASLPTGGTQTFTATPTCTNGGCPSSVSYIWSVNNTLGALSTNSGTSTAFTADTSPGTAGVTVTATLNGVTVRSTVTVTISSTSTGGGGGLLSGMTLWLVIIVIAAVVAAILVAVLLRRRGKDAESSPLEPSQMQPWGPPQDAGAMPPPQQWPEGPFEQAATFIQCYSRSASCGPVR